MEKKLKIVSDGTTAGTKVMLEDGTLIGGIQGVQIMIDSQRQLVSARIIAENVPVELAGLPVQAIYKVTERPARPLPKVELPTKPN